MFPFAGAPRLQRKQLCRVRVQTLDKAINEAIMRGISLFIIIIRINLRMSESTKIIGSAASPQIAELLANN